MHARDSAVHISPHSRAKTTRRRRRHRQCRRHDNKNGSWAHFQRHRSSLVRTYETHKESENGVCSHMSEWMKRKELIVNEPESIHGQQAGKTKRFECRKRQRTYKTFLRSTTPSLPANSPSTVRYQAKSERSARRYIRFFFLLSRSLFMLPLLYLKTIDD